MNENCCGSRREDHQERTESPAPAGSFTPEQLTSLRRSLTTHGVLQPLIVSRYDDDMYLLIEGERRWTSAKLEGIKELPVIVVTA